MFIAADSSSGSGSGSGFGGAAMVEDFEDLFFSVPRALPTQKVPHSYQTPPKSLASITYYSFKILILALLTKWAIS